MFSFEGEIDFIHDFLSLDESVYVGAPFSGSYTFDPAGVSDYYTENPSVGLYEFGGWGRMSVQIGNYHFDTGGLGILIWNDTLSGDLYQAGIASPFEAFGYQWGGMTVGLRDESAVALDSDALPLRLPNLADFPAFAGLVMNLPGDDAGLWGHLTSLTPEPGSLAILILGAALLMPKRIHWRR